MKYTEMDGDDAAHVMCWWGAFATISILILSLTTCTVVDNRQDREVRAKLIAGGVDPVKLTCSEKISGDKGDVRAFCREYLSK